MDTEKKAIELFDHYKKLNNIAQCHSLIRYYKTQVELFNLRGNASESNRYKKIVLMLEQKL